MKRTNAGLTFMQECRETIDRIRQNNTELTPLNYFLNLALKWHAEFEKTQQSNADEDTSVSRKTVSKRTPIVVVLGTSVPEQLLYAFDTPPMFVTGGSHQSCAWSDDVLPRDSDPVSRSILGYAIRLSERTDILPLFIVPITNDNMRKIAYYLSDIGQQVFSINIPPNKDNALCERAFIRSIEDMMEAVSSHLKKSFTASALRKSDELVSRAKSLMVKLRSAAAYNPAITDEAVLIVLNSYYYTNDLSSWISNLELLCALLEVKAKHETNRIRLSSHEAALGSSVLDRAYTPKVLIIGSSVLFPAYKVPELVAACGLSIHQCVDAVSPCESVCLDEGRRGSASSMVKQIARKYMLHDASSAYVVNDCLERSIRQLIASGEVEGVICHILKGHIEYDFELNRMESIFDDADIPVFRLETDYQYQDLEQLRIRLEAFGEMLNQRMLVRARAVSA